MEQDFIDLDLTENSFRVLERRYLKKDHDGRVVETPIDMFKRVAENIASAEAFYDPGKIDEVEREFLDVMTSMKFIPNSPTLMNAGRELQQLSACFVLEVGDSMESIFEAIKDTALIHKSGGGTGFAFSRIRPKNDVVMTTKGVSSGPISFMKVFNVATETIKQGGTRRGANMGVLRVDHPDIMEFIRSKEVDDSLNNFNISVAITDDFMKCVENDEEYPLINPRTGELMGHLRAKEVFDTISEMAWMNGEPGIIFIDRMNEGNPTPKIGIVESTNPCGEQPLLPYESCNLGSINLEKMIRHGEVDFKELRKTVRTAVHFLDNVIDVNAFPLQKIKEMTESNRKIGLGVMGFADLLIRLGIPYGSEESLGIAEKVMSTIQEESKVMSHLLSKERGVFPNFDNSIYADGPGMRNATTTTIAPTGTISIIAGCSSGIEPLFAISYYRNVLDNEKLVEVNFFFEEVARQNGFYGQDLMRRIADEGSIQNIEEIDENIKKVFLTAHDISYDQHIRIQAVFQKYTDNAVSKTINMPNTAKKEDVRKIYSMAYQNGLKGVTIYRDGSRKLQVLNKGEKKDLEKIESGKEISDEDRQVSPKPRPRPQFTVGTTEKIKTGCGNLYVTINTDDNGLCELFTQMGKSGGCTASQSEAISRLVSLALRSGIATESIIKHLRGIRCPTPIWQSKGGLVLSCPDAISHALANFMKDYKKSNGNGEVDDDSSVAFSQLPKEMVGLPPACPECGSMVEYQEGCYVCKSCGYTKCW